MVAEHKCPLCQDEQKEKEVHQLYSDWCESDRLARLTSLSEKDIIDHAKMKLWDIERQKDTTKLYRAIIRVGGEFFLKNPHKMRADTMVTAARQLDKIEGREQQARKNDIDIQRDAAKIEAAIHQSLKDGGRTEEVLKVYREVFPDYPDIIDSIEDNVRKSAVFVTYDSTRSSH